MRWHAVPVSYHSAAANRAGPGRRHEQGNDRSKKIRLCRTFRRRASISYLAALTSGSYSTTAAGIFESLARPIVVVEELGQHQNQGAPSVHCSGPVVVTDPDQCRLTRAFDSPRLHSIFQLLAAFSETDCRLVGVTRHRRAGAWRDRVWQGHCGRPMRRSRSWKRESECRG